MSVTNSIIWTVNCKCLFLNKLTNAKNAQHTTAVRNTLYLWTIDFPEHKHAFRSMLVACSMSFDLSFDL